jgi:hypothetical protein
MPNRRGVSLAELLLTMSACTVILTMSAGLIHRAMHTQSRSRSFFDTERSAMRLSESFRRDVHAADDAAVIGNAEQGEGVFLRLQLPGSQMVEYRLAAGRVQRLLHVDGSVKSREAFVFAADTQLTLEKSPQHLVVLSIVPPSDTAGPADRPPLTPYSTPASLRAEAVLGRNASLVDLSAPQEDSP